MSFGSPRNLEALKERAHQRRNRRRKRIGAVIRASKGQLIAERSEIVDWFDQLPLKMLKAVHRAAKIQFGEKPWTSYREQQGRRKP